MNICLNRVTKEDKDTLFRLLEYSLFEESLYDGNEMNNNAIFDYKNFDNYFIDEDKEAYLITEKDTNKLLGFVMISNNEEHIIEEFMIIPKYRRRKIGKQVAFQCFDMYQGTWKVSPSFGSNVAKSFWENVIEKYTNNKVELINNSFVFKK